MDRYKEIEAFVQVMEHGSLAAAALHAGITPVMMGRRIDALERRLGTQLIHRSTRRLALTDQGAGFLDECRTLLAQWASAEATVSAQKHRASGHLVVSAPAAFGRLHVAPLVVSFLKQHPDLSVELPDLSRLTATIYANNLLFNFATDYVKTHPKIAEAKEYKLSDEDYALFKKRVLEDDFTYSTASEELLKKMKETIEREKLDEESKAEYDALMAKVTPSKERDLDKYQDEVKMLLENEIVSRYYYQKGRVLNSFNHDDILTKGIEILKNSQEYNTILKK